VRTELGNYDRIDVLSSSIIKRETDNYLRSNFSTLIRAEEFLLENKTDYSRDNCIDHTARKGND
jgi:hypothetical protein